MELGIPIPHITPPTSPEAIERAARAADDLGFHSVWLADHLVRPDYAGFTSAETFNWDLYEPYVTAGYVAAVTKRIRIAFGVLVIPYRNPLIQAKMIATLDRLSHGRIMLGVGVGSLAGEFDALGVSMRGRGKLTDEYLAAFQALWSSERPSVHSEHITVENVWVKPTPVQERIPIWVGGSSDAALRRAVKHDGWHVARLSPQALRPLTEKIQRFAAEQGRDLSEFTLSARPTILFLDKPIPGDDPYFRDGAALPGTVIAGPPEYVAEKIMEYETVGITHLVPDLSDWWTGQRGRWNLADPVDHFLRAIETLATKVVPLLPPVSKQNQPS